MNKYTIEELIKFLELEIIILEDIAQEFNNPEDENDVKSMKAIREPIDKFQAVIEELYRLKDLEN